MLNFILQKFLLFYCWNSVSVQLPYIRDVQSYPQRPTVGAGFHSIHAWATPVSSCLTSWAWLVIDSDSGIASAWVEWKPAPTRPSADETGHACGTTTSCTTVYLRLCSTLGTVHIWEWRSCVYNLLIICSGALVILMQWRKYQKTAKTHRLQ